MFVIVLIAKIFLPQLKMFNDSEDVNFPHTQLFSFTVINLRYKILMHYFDEKCEIAN